MTTRSDAMTSGSLRWDAGGWFGALFGSSLWMPLAGLSERDEPLVLATGLVAFVLAWALGVVLWRRRAGRSPLGGMLTLLTGLGLLGAAVLGAADHAGRLDQLASGWTLPVTPWAALAIYPVVMLVLVLVNRRGPRAPA